MLSWTRSWWVLKIEILYGSGSNLDPFSATWWIRLWFRIPIKDPDFTLSKIGFKTKIIRLPPFRSRGFWWKFPVHPRPPLHHCMAVCKTVFYLLLSELSWRLYSSMIMFLNYITNNQTMYTLTPKTVKRSGGAAISRGRFHGIYTLIQ